MKKKIFILFILLCGYNFAAETSSLEGYLSDATLAYHNKAYDEADAILDEALQRYEGNKKLLELKALAYKERGDFDKARKVYVKLIKSGRASGSKPSELAPYYFEMGVIYYQLNEPKKSAPYFRQAIRSNFNKAPSHFFLGELYLEKKNLYRARDHFQKVVSSQAKDLHPAAHLKLAQIGMALKNSRGSIRNYVAARKIASVQGFESARSLEARGMAKQVVATADQALRGVDRNVWYANVGLQAAYDSNVLFTPLSVASPAEGPSGRGSFKSVGTWLLGYATSPIGNLQIAPSLAGSANYNFNSASRTSQFLSNNLSSYFTFNPMDPFHYGVRAAGTFNLKYGVDSSSNTRQYRTFSLSGTLAAYARYELNQRWLVGAELGHTQHHFYLDSEQPSGFGRTGDEQSLSFFAKHTEVGTLWNPGVLLAGNVRSTVGTEYDARGVELTLSNTFYLENTMLLELSMTGGYVSFPQRVGTARQDIPLSVAASFGFQLFESTKLLADASFTRNISTVDDPYEFNRWVLMSGLSHTF